MTYIHLAENGLTDIGKLLKLKVSSFEAIDTEPGEFFMKGKKLFFDAPAIEFGDEYFASATITYTNKKGKVLTQDFDFVIEDSDGIKSVVSGDDGPNSLLLNMKKALLIYGFGGNDIVEASTKNDKIYGGDGDDELYGFEGNDKLLGEGGNDILNGGLGDDLIHGGDGDDTIFARAGSDVITGGEGIDSFGIYSGDGSDIIKDFVSGVDKIYFEESRFNEADFAGIATKTATGTILKFDDATSVTLEGFFL